MHFSTLWFYDKSDDFSFLLILVLIYEQFPHYSSLQKMWTYDDDIVSTWAKLPQYLYAPKNNQNKTFCQTFFSWVQFDNEFSASYLDKELLPYEMSLQTLRVLNSKNPICSEYWSILFYFCAFFVAIWFKILHEIIFQHFFGQVSTLFWTLKNPTHCIYLWAGFYCV